MNQFYRESKKRTPIQQKRINSSRPVAKTITTHSTHDPIGMVIQRIKSGKDHSVQLQQDVLTLQPTIGSHAVVQLLSQAQAQKQNGTGDTASIHTIVAAGVQGNGQKLPYFEKLQATFGKHDISHVQAYTGSQAAVASRAINAKAYTTGNKIAFAEKNPSLHTVAHEAAHTIQQQAGIQLKAGIGQVNDYYEREADTVADKVVQGKSAENILNKCKPNDTSAIPDASSPSPIQMMQFDYWGKQVDTEGDYDTSKDFAKDINNFIRYAHNIDPIEVLKSMLEALNSKDKQSLTPDEKDAITFLGEKIGSAIAASTPVFKNLPHAASKFWEPEEGELVRKVQDSTIVAIIKVPSSKEEDVYLVESIESKQQSSVSKNDIKPYSDFGMISKTTDPERLSKIQDILNKKYSQRWAFSGSLAMYLWSQYLGVESREPKDVDILADAISAVHDLTDIGFKLPKAPGLNTKKSTAEDNSKDSAYGFNVDVLLSEEGGRFGNLTTQPNYNMYGFPVVALDVLIKAKENILASTESGSTKADEEITKAKSDLLILRNLKEKFAS